jgi:hypothetical protein
MTARPIVTLIVRCTGLVLVLVAVVPVIALCYRIMEAAALGSLWAYLSPLIDYGAHDDWSDRAGWAILLALGLYMLLRGRWLIGLILRGVPPGACPVCGYDLTGLDAAAACPECGRAAA